MVPAFNIKERLSRLLASLEQQLPDPGSFETIVIDDGSTDGTKEWLEKYDGPLDLKFYSHRSNRGRSASRNTGIANASRLLILFLDGDVIAPPNLVRTHALLHDATPQAFVGAVRYSDEFGANGFTKYLETRGVMRLVVTGKIPPRYFLSGHASLALVTLRKVGGFDEKIEYGEDIDLGLRLAENGVEIFGVPSVSIIHQHVRSLRDTADVIEIFGRKTLPILCDRHPSLKSDLKLDIFDNHFFKTIIFRIFFCKTVFNSVLKLTSVLLRFQLPSAFYNYILYRSYACGYITHQKHQPD